MSHKCHGCGTVISLAAGTAPGRRDTCSKCNADLHCCLNCRFYDQSAYNSCREPQAERVLDKANSNYCDYFEFTDSATGAGSGAKKTDKQSYMKQLDNLFK